MPWESKTVKKLREEFVHEAQNSHNFSSLCREFGITRKTGYKWLERYENGAELKDLSRKPKLIANKTPNDVEQIILTLRNENPGWGAKTIKKVLENHGHKNIPCVKTVNNILNRNGCILKEESEKRHKYIRFQR
jgi:transposase-like protein